MPRTIGLPTSTDAARVRVKDFAHIGERPRSHDRPVVVRDLVEQATMSRRVMLSIGLWAKIRVGQLRECAQPLLRCSQLATDGWVAVAVAYEATLLSYSSQIASNGTRARPPVSSAAWRQRGGRQRARLPQLLASPDPSTDLRPRSMRWRSALAVARENAMKSLWIRVRWRSCCAACGRHRPSTINRRCLPSHPAPSSRTASSRSNR
jgi:hypothetical protein